MARVRAVDSALRRERIREARPQLCGRGRGPRERLDPGRVGVRPRASREREDDERRDQEVRDGPPHLPMMTSLALMMATAWSPGRSFRRSTDALVMVETISWPPRSST